MFAVSVRSQANDVDVSLSMEVVNDYIWRGQDLGEVSLQPSLDLSFRGFYGNVLGNIGLSDLSDTKEVDITVGYKTGGLNIGVSDWWFSRGGDPQGRYFKYDAHTTNHILEANIGYDFGVVGFQWYTNIAGNDGVNNDGKRAYSSYAEANVPFKVCKLDWLATAGVVPTATTYYGTTGFAVTNLTIKAVKEISVTERFSIPVFAAITANPCSQKAYFVFGVKLRH